MTIKASNSPRRAEPSQAELSRLPSDGGEGWNRLVFEKSPYLLQHAANPVDWYPWGEEAFETARKLDKPVFLSIGYSTCHWCHVMEHESFENEDVARLMNETFVCVKVDREERPDVDHVYMTVTQAMTGSGGWPMTIIMTADKKPFFAGTYIPRESKYGRAGMLDFIPHIAKLWKTDRTHLIEMSDYITSELQKLGAERSAGDPDTALIDAAFHQFDERFDEHKGGFSERPKFPVPHNLSFLMRYHHATGNRRAMDLVEKTLGEMRLGGIYDHVGFGFHRYSTDENWIVPHFEKMLYDNALQAIAYTEAWQINGNPLHRQTAREVLAYIQRDMTSPEGGFYSAEDADSEGEEGKFYVWSNAEVHDALGTDATRFLNLYQFEAGGNFLEESTGHRMGTNIPHLTKPLSGEEAAAIEPLRARLFAVREKRIHPLKDDKILTDWNGLAIAAFAKYAMATGDETALLSARQAADFCLTELRDGNGRLLKRSRKGEAGLPAHLEDYAFLAYGLTELYEATFDSKYLIAALELSDTMLAHFGDANGGGLFQTADDGEKLIVRSKDIYDGALPSGNSVAAYVLIRLGRAASREDFEHKAREILRSFSGTYQRGPSQFAFSLMAAQLALRTSREIILAGNIDDPELQAMAAEARRRFLPETILLLRPASESDPLFSACPELRSNRPIHDKATAYVCENFVCKNPLHSVAELRALLDKEVAKD
ncbi:thioredoxin domain-containing protein [Candidatus Sumerlaeota bacterium]|nr:thioredoxin domain-containing protein [Candidatus Sumerlaeota bacterium]